MSHSTEHFNTDVRREHSDPSSSEQQQQQPSGSVQRQLALVTQQLAHANSRIDELTALIRDQDAANERRFATLLAAVAKVAATPSTSSSLLAVGGSCTSNVPAVVTVAEHSPSSSQLQHQQRHDHPADDTEAIAAGQTAALIAAAKAGRIDVVQLVAGSGCSLTRANEHNETAATAAACAGHAQILAFLESRGVALTGPAAQRTPIEGKTCAMLAAERGHLAAVTCILHQQQQRSPPIMPNVLALERTPLGYTLAMAAAVGGNAELLRFVLSLAPDAESAGALLSEQNADDGCNAAMYAAFAGRVAVLELIAELCPASLRATDHEGCSVAYFAESGDQPDALAVICAATAQQQDS